MLHARLYRQGQKETVVIHHILAKETIDEAIGTAIGAVEGLVPGVKQS